MDQGAGPPPPGTTGPICTFYEGDNCWKQAIGIAAPCLPAQADHGTLSADGLTCTYASGAVVTFDSPLTFPVDNGVAWKFSVKSAGQTCLRLDETKNGSVDFKLTVSSGTVDYHVDSSGVSVSCPDGRSFSGSQVAAISCGDGSASPTNFPGAGDVTGPSSVTLSLGGAQEGTHQIFSCSR